MTTPEDQLFDDLCDVAADYLIRKGITTGVQQLAQAMQQTAVDQLADTAFSPNPSLAERIASFETSMKDFDALLAAESKRLRQLREGVNRPLGTEPQS